MERKIRHLQHGNVTISINAPAEIIDRLKVDLNLFDASRGATGSGAVLNFEKAIRAIGGEFGPPVMNEFLWRNAVTVTPLGLAITVFA